MTQHDSPTTQRRWIAVIAWRGMISQVGACPSHEAAEQKIAKYLREHHRYLGENHLPTIADWVAEHEPDFDVQIIEQDISPALLAPPDPLDELLQPGQFIVMTLEFGTAVKREYSAWLYEGELDFKRAFPVRFGIGKTIAGAVDALARELGRDCT